MSLVKRNEAFPAWSNLFSDFFDRNWLDWSNRNFSLTNTTLPSVNIKESNESFDVEVAAPGLSKEDFRIELNNDLLTISSEKKDEKTEEESHYTSREFSYQSFSRSFSLPGSIERENISAKYENGILFITIPKKEEARSKPVRQIEIH
jgi:HSP20 family protein